MKGSKLSHKKKITYRNSKGEPIYRAFKNSNGMVYVRQYFKNSLRHRDIGPAWLDYFSSGVIRTEVFMYNGLYHREHKPAYIEYYSCGSKQAESYYINGKCHRGDGPAYIEYRRDGTTLFEDYYLDDIKLSRADWFSYLSERQKIDFIYKM
jgi:antitoxin component YwqK of YwqJK toxin-antitoxin module